jgi:hypothetical protein
VVEIRELGGEFCSDFVSLESAAGCEDGYFGHDGAEVDGTGFAFEMAGCFDVFVDFFFDERDVRFQGFLAEAEFDELVAREMLERLCRRLSEREDY